jgi:hypothetical protein
MLPWECALWGLLGAASIEGAEIFQAIRRTRELPWQNKQGPGGKAFLVSVVIRLGLGAVLAMVLGASGQISGALGAFVTGLAAPVLIEKMLGEVERSGEPGKGTLGGGSGAG